MQQHWGSFVTRTWRCQALRRHLSTSSKRVLLARHTGIKVEQGGNLKILCPERVATIEITSAWADHCDITVFRIGSNNIPAAESLPVGECSSSVETEDITFDFEGESGNVVVAIGEADQRDSTRVEGKSLENRPAYLIQATIPQLFSVETCAGYGSFQITNKLKGFCKVCLDSGDIEVGTVRGECIELSTGDGRVNANELEGNIEIYANKVDAKLVNGARVSINSAGLGSCVTLGGIYSPEAIIAAEGEVEISSSHGVINVAGENRNVTLWGVNGAAEVSTGGGDISVHLEELEPGTCSQMRSCLGNISVSVSPEVEADVDITGTIKKLTESFLGQAQGNRALGKTMRQSEASVGNNRSRATSMGKINLLGAREQSLQNFIKEQRHNQVALPGVMLATEKGSVSLETLGWADMIRRKCGLA
ncbi:unnamed protein product [Choristocarpus tenellus]